MGHFGPSEGDVLDTFLKYKKNKNVQSIRAICALCIKLEVYSTLYSNYV